jgi:hypothetical protein
MTDGRFKSGKDENGAFFIDRNPQFFNIVLDVHRDNQVYPLPVNALAVTRERVISELEFYGLEDVQVPTKVSAESAVQGMGDFSKWQWEQETIGMGMLVEGVTRLLFARAVLLPDKRSVCLKSGFIELSSKLWEGAGLSRGTVQASASAPVFTKRIVELFATWNFKATVFQINGCESLIKLEPAEPAARARK